MALAVRICPKSLQLTCRDTSLIIVSPQWPHVNVQFSFASVLSGTDLFYCFVVRVACGACLHTEGTYDGVWPYCMAKDHKGHWRWYPCHVSVIICPTSQHHSYHLLSCPLFIGQDLFRFLKYVKYRQSASSISKARDCWSISRRSNVVFKSFRTGQSDVSERYIHGWTGPNAVTDSMQVELVNGDWRWWGYSKLSSKV